jgi:hypothetical protein
MKTRPLGVAVTDVDAQTHVNNLTVAVIHVDAQTHVNNLTVA